MAEGVVRWWGLDRGWGFIRADGQPDVFVHHLALEGRVSDLRAGQEVEFETVAGTIGSVATNVRVI